MRIGRAVAGAVVGALVGFTVAVNVVIFSGAEDGYETSLPEVFDQGLALGVLVVGIVLVGPIIGAVLAVRGSDPTDDERGPSEPRRGR